MFCRAKNGAIVRQVVGYDRFVGEHASAATHRTVPCAALVCELLPALHETPLKIGEGLIIFMGAGARGAHELLLAKQREGKKVRYVYDPAKTPLQRLLLSGVLPAQKQRELLEVAHALDPIRLFQHVEQLQQAVFRCAVSASPFASPIPSASIRVFSVERCTAGKFPVEGSIPDPAVGLQTLYQEQERRKWVLGWRRTHKDPFAGEWERIISWLMANPERSSGDIFRELQRLSPERYQPLQIRTLQRGMRKIRAYLLETFEEQWQEEVIGRPLLSPVSAEGPPAYPDRCQLSNYWVRFW